MKFEYVNHTDVISAWDCEDIIKQYSQKLSVAVTADEAGQHRRKSNIVFIEDRELKTHIANFAAFVNRRAFGFNLDLAYFDLQFTEYLAEEQGHYDWHIDITPDRLKQNPGQDSVYDRKLSVTLLLSHPDDYEGGNLELITSLPTDAEKYRQQGSAVVFPSFIGHRVTPVTKGKRYSLVAWLEGPKFQ